MLQENDDVQFGVDDWKKSITDLDTKNDNEEDPEIPEPKLTLHNNEPNEQIDTGSKYVKVLICHCKKYLNKL